jgi:hypothetical protein
MEKTVHLEVLDVLTAVVQILPIGGFTNKSIVNFLFDEKCLFRRTI